VRIKATDKGRAVHDVVDQLYQKHARTLEAVQRLVQRGELVGVDGADLRVGRAVGSGPRRKMEMQNL